jgi:hypothetical protein
VRVLVKAAGYTSVYLRTTVTPDAAPLAIRLRAESVLEGSCLRAENDQPVVGAQISVTQMDPPERYRTRPADVTTMTDGSGHFVLRGLSEGRYRLTAAGGDASIAEELILDVAANSPGNSLVLKLETTTEVAITATTNGQPRPGVIMRLCRESETTCSYGVLTQADGRVTVHGVFFGRNELRPVNADVIGARAVEIRTPQPPPIAVELAPPTPAR